MLGTSPAPVVMERQRRKRKAETHDSDRERLSKRLSRLNLEAKSRLHAAVGTPAIATTSSTCPKPPPSDETMQLDDSKHKVYIYDIDAELSSDSDTDDGKLVFLPDIEKHLRENRIPRHILANDEGELAGMQLVLYSDPKSISVPEERDGVRRAIIEARKRAREGQKKLDRPSEVRSSGTPSQTAPQMCFQTVAETTPHSDSVANHILPVDDAGDAMEVD